MLLASGVKQSVVGRQKAQSKCIRRQTVSKFKRARELNSVQSAQNMAGNQSRCPVYQSIGVWNQKVFLMGVGNISPQQKDSSCCDMSWERSRRYKSRCDFEGRQEGLIEYVILAIQQSANPIGAFLRERTFGQCACIQKIDHQRSSRDSIISRLRPVNFLPILSNLRRSTPSLTGPTSRSRPGQPFWPTPSSSKRSRREGVDVFFAISGFALDLNP
jgi:hypothetical protein